MIKAEEASMIILVSITIGLARKTKKIRTYKKEEKKTHFLFVQSTANIG
jgi:hypothetical protein